MPRLRREPKVRLNLDIPEAVRERLDRLRELSEADTLTEVIRRALAAYEVLLTNSHAHGSRIIIRDPDGTETELRLI